MKKFSFSFQYLLDARRAKEQAAEQALLKAVRKQAEVELALLKMKQDRERQVKVLEQMSGVVRRSEFSAYIRNVDRLQRELDVLENDVRKYAEQVETCRTTLRNEMISRQILENLRERERSDWAEAFQSEEQKMMDELAVARWSRQEQTI